VPRAVAGGEPPRCGTVLPLRYEINAVDIQARPERRAEFLQDDVRKTPGGLPRVRMRPVAPESFQPADSLMPPWMQKPVAQLQSIWRAAPSDLRWATFGIPLVIAIAVFSLAGQRRPESPSEVRQSGLSTVSFLQAKWSGLRQNIGDRAAIRLSDDFRSGLSEWAGRTNWSRSWSYDPSGFARPGELALYRRSMQLTDYRFEFLGQIERKGLSWVYRARDVDNYYAMKLSLTKDGSVPKLWLIRWAVINGKERDRVQLPVPLAVQSDTIYQIRVDVTGDSFTTWIQGQVADHWTDERLKRGGVGLFATKGEASILRWISVTHHYDVLGRLCAYIAPYSLETSKGE
jgi:hypothetical protein